MMEKSAAEVFSTSFLDSGLKSESYDYACFVTRGEQAHGAWRLPHA